MGQAPLSSCCHTYSDRRSSSGDMTSKDESIMKIEKRATKKFNSDEHQINYVSTSTTTITGVSNLEISDRRKLPERNPFTDIVESSSPDFDTKNHMYDLNLQKDSETTSMVFKVSKHYSEDENDCEYRSKVVVTNKGGENCGSQRSSETYQQDSLYMSDTQTIADVYKNPIEEVIHINRHYVMNQLKDFENDPDKFYNWELVHDQPSNLKVYFAQKGSKRSQEVPFIKSEFTIDFSKVESRQITIDRYVIKKIVQAIHNPGLRIQWDKNIDELKLIKTINKNLYCVYQRNKAQNEESTRYFFEKKMIFSVKKDPYDSSEVPEMYVYVSEVPPCDQTIKPPSKALPGSTIIGVHKVEKVSDTQAKLTLYSQVDMKLILPNRQILKRAVPMSLRDWKQALEESLMKQV